MKRIEAIVAESDVESVRVALQNIGIGEMKATRAEGFVNRATPRKSRVAETQEIRFAPKSKIDVIVFEEELRSAIDVLSRATSARVLVDGRLLPG